MNSHDPNFPQDLPVPPEAAIPEAEDSDREQPNPDRETPDATSPDAISPELASEGLTAEIPIQATEVWTELDEAEPGAVAGAEGKKEGEPDPSGLDSGSGPRREAEKPGRTSLPYDDWEPSQVPYQPKELGVIDQIMIILAEGAAIWRNGLRQVRSWLPRPWQRNLNDERMTAIALGLLILWLVLWNPLGGRGAASRVAVEEPIIPSPALAQRGNPASPAASLAGDEAPLAPAIAADPATDSLEPSPEQSLIADIQDRVSKISRSYAVGLIQSVEVNLPQQVIAINLSNDWYGLGAESQDRIAQDIYTQAQGLAFATLQLRDAEEGGVVARNPVVGPSMVILKRHRPGEG
jgi:hypothetical protein